MTRPGLIAVSISPAAGLARALTTALTTTGGMTITGPERVGTG